MKKFYVIEEKIDTNTYYVKYVLDDIKFAYCLLKAMREKHSTKVFRLVRIVR